MAEVSIPLQVRTLQTQLRSLQRGHGAPVSGGPIGGGNPVIGGLSSAPAPAGTPIIGAIDSTA